MEDEEEIATLLKGLFSFMARACLVGYIYDVIYIQSTR